MNLADVFEKMHLLYDLIYREGLNSKYNFYKHERREELLLFIGGEDREIYDWLLSLDKELRNQLMENLYMFYSNVHDNG